MKVCVTSRGTLPASLMDPRFGRARHLLLCDTETGDVRPIRNDPGAARGAGVLAAQEVVRSGAVAVLTGQLGPKAFEVLEAAGIPAYRATGITVEVAIQDFTDGQLDRIGSAEGQPHAGMGA